MNQPYRPYPSQGVPYTTAGSDIAAFMRKVYALMTGGLLATAVTAMAVASSETAIQLILGNRIVFYGLMLAELVLVWNFARITRSLSATGAAGVFLLYSVLNGLTLSVIFLAYTASSIATTFFVTAGTFGAMSLFGAVTKRDLTGVGNFMMMGLFGLIIAMVVNLFLQSPLVTWVTTCMGVLIFVGLTAYDTQKLRSLASASSYGAATGTQSLAIHGALTLYLDFINLFLFMLRLLGGGGRR
jgi:uncharacterized protein